MQLRSFSDNVWGISSSVHMDAGMAFHVPASWSRVSVSPPAPRDPFAPFAEFADQRTRLVASVLWLPRLADARDLLDVILHQLGPTHVRQRDSSNERSAEAILRTPGGLRRIRMDRSGRFVFRLEAATEGSFGPSPEELSVIFDSVRVSKPSQPVEPSLEINQGPISFRSPAVWTAAPVAFSGMGQAVVLSDPSLGWIRSVVSPKSASPAEIAQEFAGWYRSHGAILRGAPVAPVSPTNGWNRQFVYAPLADRGPEPYWTGLTIREGEACWHSIGFLGVSRATNPWKAAILKATVSQVLETVHCQEN